VVTLNLSGFKVEIEDTIIQGMYINQVIKELRDFSDLKIEEADFTPLEPVFELFFSFSSLKKVVVKGNVNYPVGVGATLDFEFETDLTYMDKFIEGLKLINIVFSITGLNHKVVVISISLYI